MRILWLSHVLPFPPRGGNLQRSFNLIKEISRSHTVSLVAFNFRGDSPETLKEYQAELRKHCEDVTIWELPYRWRSARWWAELALSSFSNRPITSRALWSPALARAWEQVLAKNSGALVHLDSPDLALFAPQLQGFRKVLNHHNCESAMAARRAEIETNALKRAYLRQHASKLARLERNVCHQFDVNTVVSTLDAQTLREINPKAHIHVVENGTDTNYFHPTDEPVETQSLVFAGSLDWYPNLSAIRFFTREVWPIIRQRYPNALLCLAGQNPPAWLAKLAEDSHIRLVSNPADIRPVVARASVFICPIRDGGGTRLKILDAMAMGKPVVSTRVGCEGLEVVHGQHILIANEPAAFAQEIFRLFEDATLKQSIAEGGRALAVARYSWEQIARDLEEAYRCAAQGGACGHESTASATALK
jgi:sugar transferase (PEP-CTERM/EpsH1 system associated)